VSATSDRHTEDSAALLPASLLLAGLEAWVWRYPVSVQVPVVMPGFVTQEAPEVPGAKYPNVLFAAPLTVGVDQQFEPR
jgi:hypothetical protein